MARDSRCHGRNSLLFATALSTGVLALSAANVAAAVAADSEAPQGVPQLNVPAQQLAQAAPANGQTAQAPAVEEVVITGSLIVRNGFQAPTPVTVLNVEEIQNAAEINFGDYANKIPTLGSSLSSHADTSSTATGNAGANILNLRGLNGNRTLVLIDGMRVTASSTSGYYGDGGAVDINVFPDAMISRVDIVTGGATATYGSGAVAGAVNFILDTNFTGVKGSVTGGITTYGDDPEYAVNVTAGTNFSNDRGHAVISASDSWNAGISNGYSRSWLNPYTCKITNPSYTATNGQPYYLIETGCVSAATSPGGLITSGPLKGTTFGAGGTPEPFTYGSISDGVEMLGGGPSSTGPIQNTWGPDSSLDIMVARQNLFTRVGYDVTDDMNVYAEYIYALTTDESAHRSNTITGTISSGNPFIPTTIQAEMTQLGIASFPFGEYVQAFPRDVTRNRRHFGDFVGGVKGSFEAMGTKWSYDLFVTDSETLNSNQTFNGFQKAEFANAINAVVNPKTGQIVCAINLTNPSNPCVAYNPLGTGVASQAAINYLVGTPDQQFQLQDLELQEVKAVLRGEPFSTWAGPVSVAIGGEYQYNKAHGIADPVDEAAGYTITNYDPVLGSYHATEGYGEVVIPLAKDASWAKALDVNAGVRETDFSTSGDVTTYKVGATYTPIDDIRFRVTQSRDTRQPNMGELFSTSLFNGPNASGQNPWLNNKTVTFSSFTAGNPALQPEKANNTGIGAVYQPSWLPGFSASVDYYHIKINGAVATLSTQLTINDCYNGQAAYCSFIVQDANHNISSVTQASSNTAGQIQSGLDIEGSYMLHLADLVSSWDGTLTARALITHIMTQSSTAPDGTVTPGVNPPWRYNTSLTYNNDSWSLEWTGRGIGNALLSGLYTACTSGCPAAIAPNYTINTDTIPGRFYMDANVTYHLRTDAVRYDVFLTIENLANTNPPGIVLVGGTSNFPDPLGRVFRAGVRFKM